MNPALPKIRWHIKKREDLRGKEKSLEKYVSNLAKLKLRLGITEKGRAG